MTYEQLQSGIDERAERFKDESVIYADSMLIEFLLDNCEIDIPGGSRFFGKVNTENLIFTAQRARTDKFRHLIDDAGLSLGESALAHTGACDFSHTNAEWESVLSLGIYGLSERVRGYLDRCTDDSARDFYTCVLRCYDAALRFMRRAATVALELGRDEMGEGLLHLCEGAPRNLFELMQTTVVY